MHVGERGIERLRFILVSRILFLRIYRVEVGAAILTVEMSRFLLVEVHFGSQSYTSMLYSLGLALRATQTTIISGMVVCIVKYMRGTLLKNSLRNSVLLTEIPVRDS